MKTRDSQVRAVFDETVFWTFCRVLGKHVLLTSGENHEIAETRIPRFLIGPQPKKSLVAAEVKIVVKMGSRNE